MVETKCQSLAPRADRVIGSYRSAGGRYAFLHVEESIRMTAGGAERTGWCFQAAGVGDVWGSRHRVSLQNGSFADGLRVTACPAQDDKLVEFSFVRLSVRLSSSEPSAVILNQRNGSGAPVKDLFCGIMNRQQ